MKRVNFIVVGTVVLAATAVIQAQDAAKADPAHYKVLIDNASVRVLEINYSPGGKSVMHQHPDSIVVPLAESKVEFTLPDGTSQTQSLAKDSAQYSPAGTHNPRNVGTTPLQALLVEFKGAAPGRAALPANRPGMQIKTLAEGPRGSAYASTAGPDFAEPAGTTHDFDQVVIALGPSAMSLAIDGKPAKTAWKRGDVQFVGRGVPHQARNTGGNPVDMIIVAIK
jgi:mannose-6-phosphate isomerase-like protein (cupin superfamily)